MRSATEISTYTGAELAAASVAIAIAAAVILSYFADRLGLGVAAVPSAAGALTTGAVLLVALRPHARWNVPDILCLAGVSLGTFGYLLWLAWPDLLPRGNGPDLTHHLLLVDYIERHRQLVHDSSAAAYLGEMADYTPGLHLLSIIGAAIARTDGFHAIYTVVAVTVALKWGLFVLVSLRLFAGSPLRRQLAVLGVLLVLLTPAYSIGSFSDDSFLAQAVAELFAVVAWWAVLVWDQRPTLTAAGLFATAGIAAFLTWPVWIGPPVLAFVILAAGRRELTPRARFNHIALAILPIALVAVVHAVGRTAWVSIVATSGAVVQPSPAVLGWWLPLLALGGLTLAVRERRHRSLVVFAGALVAQAIALLLVAKAKGATTPYMAVKMTYLALYPAISFALIAIDRVWQTVTRAAPPSVSRLANGISWLVVLAVAIVTVPSLPSEPKTPPVVSNDLYEAGRWARDHVPVDCVDYLVGNEYTAYWLHLAVLGNPRVSERTRNDETFLTQPSIGRWLVPGGLRYAIANLKVLPSEIRHDVDVMQQFGTAAIVARRGQASCP